MSTHFATITRLTAAGASARLRAKQIAAQARLTKGLDSRTFAESYALAQEIDPSAQLDYIPMWDREEISWWVDVDANEWRMNHPKRGEFVWE